MHLNIFLKQQSNLIYTSLYMEFLIGAALDTNIKQQDGASNNQSKINMKSFKLIQYFKKCDMEKSCKNKIKIMGNEKQKEKYQHFISQKREGILKLITDMQCLLKTSIDRIKNEENQYILNEFESQVQNMHQYIKTQIESMIDKTSKQNFEILNFLKDFVKNDSFIENNSQYISSSPSKTNYASQSQSPKKGHNITFNTSPLLPEQKKQISSSRNLQKNYPVSPLLLFKKYQISKVQQPVLLNITSPQKKSPIKLNNLNAGQKIDNLLKIKLRSYSVNNNQSKINT